MHTAFAIEKRMLTFVKAAFFLLFFFGASSAYAATLSLTPSTGVYTAGATFSASVVVNTNGASINAADGTLTFNPKEITVISVSKGSIFNLWTAEPSFSNAAGTITFSGGSPTGYTGGNGVVISIAFRSVAAGSPRVSFSKGSVLAADGKGTNVLTTMNGGAYTIGAKEVAAEPEKIEYVAPANTPSAPKVESSTHPDSTKWYNVKRAELSWSIPSDVVAIRTLLDSNAGSIPTKVYDTPIKNVSIEDLPEGISFFHIQFKNANGWGKVSHYRLAVDSEKPTSFDIKLAEGNDVSNPSQMLALEAHDAASQVRRFLIQLDGKDPYEFKNDKGSSTVALPQLEPGHHSAIIEAFDEAGNSIIGSFSFAIIAFDKPQFTEYPKEINEQVIPVIKGITKPHSKVSITVTQIGSTAVAKTYAVDSADSGEFIFIPDGKLSLGVYELTAVAVDQYGAKSAVSDAVRIAVQIPGYLRIGSFVVSLLSVIVPLLSLVALLVLGTWFLLFRMRLLKKGVTKEAKEAVSILSSEFSKLNKELINRRAALESSRKTGKLTKVESDLFDSLTQALREGEKRIEKEIVDVEDLVD